MAPRTAFVYLASQSPRRSQLLEQLDVPHRLLVPVAADEVADLEALERPLDKEAPARYVQRVTALKLDAAMQRLARSGLPAAPVLCADTTVAVGSRILGKPAHAQEARAMLEALAGRRHRVLTAVAVQAGRRRWQALCESQVWFGPMTAADIRRYIATGEPMGKAGAYAIQGRAAAWVQRIRGSHSGIMGLPLWETAQLLRAAGLPL